MDMLLLEDCCDILDSQRVPITAADRTKGEYPYYGANGIQDYVADYIFDDELVLLAEDGGNFGSKERPIAYRVSGKCWVNNHAHVLKPKAEIDVDYLCYSLMFYNTDGLVNGATRQKLTQATMRKMLIPKRSLEEQKKIVNKLAITQSIITHRKQQLLKLDELVKARFVEMFGMCTNEVLIGDVVSICRGASPRPIQAFITDDENGVNWIKIGDVSDNSLYITKTAEKITHEGAKKSRAVRKGDFILSNSMSFGRPYILGIDGCVHDGWLILSNFDDRFNELYLYYALRSEYIQHQFSGKVNGATVKNLNSDLVKSTYIKVPDIEMQEIFADFVKSVDKSKVAVQKALDEAQLLFDSLMQEYFG